MAAGRRASGPVKRVLISGGPNRGVAGRHLGRQCDLTRRSPMRPVCKGFQGKRRTEATRESPEAWRGLGVSDLAVLPNLELSFKLQDSELGDEAVFPLLVLVGGRTFERNGKGKRPADSTPRTRAGNRALGPLQGFLYRQGCVFRCDFVATRQGLA